MPDFSLHPYWIALPISGACAAAAAFAGLRQKFKEFEAIERCAPQVKPLSKADIADFEKDLPNLKAINILCQSVMKPDSKFTSAVTNNLRSGVKYHFHVSASSRQIGEDRFKKYFKSCIDIIDAENETSCASDLFSYNIMGFDWDDYPYIFYKYEDRDAAGEERIAAFRGLDRGVGIADFYEAIDAKSAQTIMRLIGISSRTTVIPQSEAYDNVVRLVASSDK